MRPGKEERDHSRRMHSQRKVGGSLGIPKASSYLHILQRNLLSGWLHIKWNFWLLAGSLITEASYQFPRDSWPRVPSNSLLLFSNQGVGPGFLRESVLTMQRTSPGGMSRAVNKVKEIRGRKEKPVRSVVFKTGDKKKILALDLLLVYGAQPLPSRKKTP